MLCFCISYRREELKFILGVSHLFFGNTGTLDKKRFAKYYCNKCGKEYPGVSSNNIRESKLRDY
ncbi:MAG TPA: hypothetical protein VF242_08020 [Nitrososphaeraceae archaeon]